MTKDEALDLALEALEKLRAPLRVNTSLDAYDVGRAITAIKQARSAPVQEPVAWRVRYHYGTDGMDKRIGDWKLVGYSPTPEKDKDIEPLYTTPPAAQRQWVGLTDEELRELCEEFWLYPRKLLQAIEAKLRSKNI